MFMAIGALVLSWDIENGYIGASHVYFPKVESIRDASIQIISPYRVEEDDISNDVDGPFLGGHKSLQPCILTNGSFFNGWKAIGPFATHSLADEFASCYLEGSHNDENSWRSEEHTSELQSLMRISYSVFFLKKKNTSHHIDFTS